MQISILESPLLSIKEKTEQLSELLTALTQQSSNGAKMALLSEMSLVKSGFANNSWLNGHPYLDQPAVRWLISSLFAIDQAHLLQPHLSYPLSENEEKQLLGLIQQLQQ